MVVNISSFCASLFPSSTFRETNIVPEKWWLEDKMSFWGKRSIFSSNFAFMFRVVTVYTGR